VSCSIQTGNTAGSGVTAGSIGGTGLIAPGNSPGILTALSLDPGAGTSFALEFTGTATTYNGQGYYSLSSWAATHITDFQGVTVKTTSVAAANFASGTAKNGWVTEFIVVPEPGTLATLAAGVMASAWFLRWRTARSRLTNEGDLDG